MSSDIKWVFQLRFSALVFSKVLFKYSHLVNCVAKKMVGLPMVTHEAKMLRKSIQHLRPACRGEWSMAASDGFQKDEVIFVKEVEDREESGLGS